MKETQHRILDPIHGLIPFHLNDKGDALAWEIINSAVFQRLRRIKQLGFAEFVFPGATHSRFSHSIGVFHLARGLAHKVKEHYGADFDGAAQQKGCAAICAALLHDVGHGAFSHAFEKVELELGRTKAHEQWTIEIIQQDAELQQLLGAENLLDEVVSMIDPRQDNLYHAIVSSAFDADRLDYLQRDRYMCGIGSGGFDSAWMLDCLEIAEQPARFRLNTKSTHNAEEYLLARYHLNINVYTHKTIRAAEVMLSRLLFELNESFETNGFATSGLNENHPLALYFAEQNIETYLALDDIVLWGALSQIAGQGKAGSLKTLAENLLHRRFYKCFDVGFMAEKNEEEKLVQFKKELAVQNPRCFVDETTIEAYEKMAGKPHQGIQIGDKDIIDLSPIIASVPIKKICRVYALDQKDVQFAKDLWKKI